MLRYGVVQKKKSRNETESVGSMFNFFILIAVHATRMENLNRLLIKAQICVITPCVIYNIASRLSWIIYTSNRTACVHVEFPHRAMNITLQLTLKTTLVIYCDGLYSVRVNYFLFEKVSHTTFLLTWSDAAVGHFRGRSRTRSAVWIDTDYVFMNCDTMRYIASVRQYLSNRISGVRELVVVCICCMLRMLTVL